MIAGVGSLTVCFRRLMNCWRMGVDVQIGYIETHGRAGTEALMQGLPVIPT